MFVLAKRLNGVSLELLHIVNKDFDIIDKINEDTQGVSLSYTSKTIENYIFHKPNVVPVSSKDILEVFENKRSLMNYLTIKSQKEAIRILFKRIESIVRRDIEPIDIRNDIIKGVNLSYNGYEFSLVILKNKLVSYDQRYIINEEYIVDILTILKLISITDISNFHILNEYFFNDEIKYK